MTESWLMVNVPVCPELCQTKVVPGLSPGVTVVVQSTSLMR